MHVLQVEDDGGVDEADDAHDDVEAGEAPVLHDVPGHHRAERVGCEEFITTMANWRQTDQVSFEPILFFIFLFYVCCT